MMMLLVLKKMSTDMLDESIYIRILNLNNGCKCIFDDDLEAEDLKGVFRSGQYTFIDGHIYYRN
jgi:hypothetical protein